MATVIAPYAVGRVAGLGRAPLGPVEAGTLRLNNAGRLANNPSRAGIRCVRPDSAGGASESNPFNPFNEPLQLQLEGPPLRLQLQGPGPKPPSAPVGSRGQQIPSIEGNLPATINGRQYSGHAIDRMQGRGLVPSVVENAITPGNRIGSGNTPGTSAYFDPINGTKVIVDDASGRVITVM